MTIAEARQILGIKSKYLSDESVQAIIIFLEGIAEVAISSYFKDTVYYNETKGYKSQKSNDKF